MAQHRTVVLCLEGAHGSGKSTLSRAFVDAGYEVLDEGFMAQPDWASSLHPQSLVMEVQWVGDWVERVMRLHHMPSANCVSPTAAKETSPTASVPSRHPVRVIIADRSPFSAVFYARSKGELLDPLIRAQLRELSDVGVHVITTLVSADEDTHWQRVAGRLQREPERAKYNEGSREWFNRARGWYETFGWDARLDNSREEITSAFGLLESSLQRYVAAVAEGDMFEFAINDELSSDSAGAESPASISEDDGSPGPSGVDDGTYNDVRGFRLADVAAPVPPPTMEAVAIP